MDVENVPIISMSLHPGMVGTEGAAGMNFGWLGPIWWLVKKFILEDPEKGAVPSLYLAAAREVEEEPERFKGLYFEPSLKAVAPSALASDPKVARNLWELSEETVKKWTVT